MCFRKKLTIQITEHLRIRFCSPHTIGLSPTWQAFYCLSQKLWLLTCLSQPSSSVLHHISFFFVSHRSHFPSPYTIACEFKLMCLYFNPRGNTHVYFFSISECIRFNISYSTQEEEVLKQMVLNTIIYDVISGYIPLSSLIIQRVNFHISRVDTLMPI